MLAALLALSLLLSPSLQTDNPPWLGDSELPIQGEVTYYVPGLMEWVYEYRLRLNQVPVCDPPECAGYVALLRPGDLGRKVWLQRPGHEADGPFLVVDYAASEDFERLSERGWVAEVDYMTAWRWAMQGPLQDVQVLPAPPRNHRLHLPLVAVDGPVIASPQPATGPATFRRQWLPLIQHDGS